MARRSVVAFGFIAIASFLSFITVPLAQQPLRTSGVAVPRFVTFSGILRDGKGWPLQGVIGVEFSLYKDQQGGAPLWTENQNVQFDEQGRYSVLLGMTQASGLPVDLFTLGEPRWLGVQVELPGEEEQPRVLLVSVPYALKAGDADTIGGKPLSAFLLAPSQDPMPSVEGPDAKSRLADITSRFAASGTGISTPTRIPKWSDANGTLSDGSIQDNGVGVSIAIATSGNVGIGTTSPSAHLEVAGSNQQINVTDTSTGYSNIRFANSNSSLYMGQENSAGTALLAGSSPYAGVINMANTNPLQIGTSNVVRMTIASSGNVGIGTTTPAAKLEVAGDLKVSGNILSPFNLNAGTFNLNAGGTLQINGVPFLQNFGTDNTFLGANAGNISMTGAENTANGYQALLSNMTGNQNTATGSLALTNNTAGFANTATGESALYSNTTGNYNTASGKASLYGNTSGYGNAAGGASALSSNTAGNFNTATGGAALFSNTTGSSNTALGYYAGVTSNGANANTTGSDNTFIGFQAGPGTPRQLTNAAAVGANALVSANNTLVLGAPGVSVAIGASTAGYTLDVQNGQINASGGLCINGNCRTSWPSINGTITGVNAGTGLTGGGTNGTVTLNIANGGIGPTQLADGAVTSAKIGGGTIVDGNISASAAINPAKIAGTAATLGTNIFVGTQTIANGGIGLSNAMDVNTGVLSVGGISFLHNFGGVTGGAAFLGPNTFVGNSAGNFTMTGNAGNVGAGFRALQSNSTGSNNTAVGQQALSSNTDGYGNTALGGGTLNVNRIGFGNTAAGAGALGQCGGNNNTGAGANALALCGGDNNTAVGSLAGSSLNNSLQAGSNNNTFIGYQAGPGTSVQLNNATAIGANALVSASNTLVLGGAGVSVAIGASSAATTLQVVGDIRVGTNGTNGCIQGFGGGAIAGVCSSDMRLKRNIAPFDLILDRLIELQPVSYEWNVADHPEYNFGSERTAGLIAQQVEKVFPSMVSMDEHGYKAVNYSQLPLLLLQALRELKSENDMRAQLQQLQLRQLRLEVEELKARLAVEQKTVPVRSP